MRTTLKRGIGRAAGLNGNGHSTLPPVFGPVARYRQPEPPRRSLAGAILRGFGWFVLALAVVGSGVAGGVYLYTHETLASVTASDKQTKHAEQKLFSVPSPNHPAIALIAGYDHRSGTGSKSFAGSNSDTLMLVRADPVHDTLSLLSLPRDLSVNIYCHGDTVYTQDRVNSAWAICGDNGPYATVDTMEHLTGLRINYLITLDFHAFKQLVNSLHGVYMNVDQRYYNPLHTGWSAINLHPGYQKLDGGQALSFVRFRHFDSDIYRTGRQQQFMEALKSRLRSSLSLQNLVFQLPKLIGALKGNLEVAKAGGGSVTLSELESYLGLAYHLPAGHLFRDQIPVSDFQPFVTAGGADELTVSPAVLQHAVDQFLHPVVKPSAQIVLPGSGSHAKKKKKTGPKLPRKQVSVLVLNASSVPGRATNTSYLLAKHGFATASLPASVPADAPVLKRGTIVYYDPVQPHAQQAAQELKPLFGAHTSIVQMTTAIASYAKQAGNPLTVVALGSSFSGTLTFPHKASQQKLPPPQVSDGTTVTAAAVRSVRGQAHFPLMIPHQIAAGSQLSTNEGVRVFKPLAGRHELVLTFNVAGTVEYWQIEESDWNTAPILQNPTGHFVYQHRRYDVYTSGGAIQMVALRTPKASYWVVNTILNQLSNSTMIAIAESLRPLGR